MDQGVGSKDHKVPSSFRILRNPSVKSRLRSLCYCRESTAKSNTVAQAKPLRWKQDFSKHQCVILASSENSGFFFLGTHMPLLKKKETLCQVNLYCLFSKDPFSKRDAQCFIFLRRAQQPGYACSNHMSALWININIGIYLFI